MNLVLFLGAGFSNAYGLPVMAEFFNHAKNALYLKNEDKAFLDTYQRKTHSAANMFDPDYGNLEDVLSFCLISENFAGKYPQETSDDYKRLCRILYEVYRHVDKPTYWNLADGQLQQILKIPKSRKELPYNLTVITTNYDITFEYIFWKIGRKLYLPNEWVEAESGGPIERHFLDNMYERKRKGGPLLCKLHGSLNWLSSETEGLIVEGSIIEKEIDTGTETKRVKDPLITDIDYSSITKEAPLIVPPTIFKLQIDPCLQNIWDAAGAALRKADNIVFIGFSFPKSDIYIRYFLAANLSENVHLDKISIVDPIAKEICERLKDPGSKFGRRFKELLVPYQDKWFNTPTSNIF